ncbi:Mitogen-activated protein kinase kinase kinase 2, partial [Branchiostoma belcheri]
MSCFEPVICGGYLQVGWGAGHSSPHSVTGAAQKAAEPAAPSPDIKARPPGELGARPSKTTPGRHMTGGRPSGGNTDEKEALNSIKNDLAAGMKQSAWHKSHSSAKSSSQTDVRVKFEFQGEKRIIQVPRPVNFQDLQSKVKTAYGQLLTMFYTNTEISIPILNQSDLEKAIILLDHNPHMKSLRIYLCKENPTPPGSPQGPPHGPLRDLFHPPTSTTGSKPVPISRSKSTTDASKKKTDRQSPPPGYIPDSEVRHSSSYTSIEGEGTFIPESSLDSESVDPLEYSSPENSGSSASLDRLSDSYYNRLRMSRTKSSSAFSDEFLGEHELAHVERAGKGGTYPRRSTIMTNPHHDYSDGRKTFPRTRRPQPSPTLRRPVGTFSPRSGSERSLSNSSSSSGLVTDSERRDSDYDLAVLSLQDLNPARCKSSSRKDSTAVLVSSYQRKPWMLLVANRGSATCQLETRQAARPWDTDVVPVAMNTAVVFCSYEYSCSSCSYEYS